MISLNKILLVIGLLMLGSGRCTIAQTPTQSGSTNWRLKRQNLESSFAADLQQIADWCRENQLPQQAAKTLALTLDRDLGRQYVFLPTTETMPVPGDGLDGEWLQKVNAAKIKHANRIFELAKTAANESAGAVAFQLLHEVIFYHRDHEEVRAMLGHVRDGSSWRVAPSRFKIRQRNNKPGYILLDTPHFKIESNAAPDRTEYLGEQLERTYLVWRQVFFEYWASPKTVKNWIDGKGKLRNSTKRFDIKFFANRDGYIAELSPKIQGIAVSRGYYSPQDKLSFFYDGEESTWRHELTHQLFRESKSGKSNTFEEQFIWIDEGLATYFESLCDFGDYVTLGGFESSRLQYARFNALLQAKPMPTEQLSSLGRLSLQRRPDVKTLYSQAAGLSHMLINSDDGTHLQPLTEFLVLVYKSRSRKSRSRVKLSTLEKKLGLTFAQLDARYLEYLGNLNSDLVANHLSQPASRTELSLPAAKLETAAYQSIGKCTQLDWLDLSKNDVRSSQLGELKKCQRLGQLILAQCRFESGPDALAELANLSNLAELNLSGSSVQDNQLASLTGIKKLSTLILSGTAISDAGILTLADITSLTQLDVSGTRVSSSALARLKSRLPNLTIAK